jgi:amidophosphoribosyltransferase
MCGVIGIVSQTNVNQSIFDALTVLQHRGQDAAGMVTCEDKQFRLRKGNGLVRDVFRTRHMLNMRGNMGIGHIRYPTAGANCASEAQPLYVNSPYGIALAHNGNLTNALDLQRELFQDDLRHINTGSDSEVILNVFAHELQRVAHFALTPNDIFKAMQNVYARCRGAYAAVALISGFGLVAFRDPNGIRPLIYGTKKHKTHTDVMVASESVALTTLGYEVQEDIAPGEAIFVTTQGEIHKKICTPNTRLSPCLFEFVYFARPDSIIDKISVYKVRMSMGRRLAKKIENTWPSEKIDVVIPIPETSRSAAMPLARALDVKFREGFVKNRYIGRTFIMPGQKAREKSVHQKLNAIDLEFNNKNVLLVDDSIVRGTTSKEIVDMARRAGAKKVFFASAAPKVKHPNIYGIDMPNSDELIAHNRTTKEICELIGADGLIYLDLSDLVEAAKEGNSDIHSFEASVFDGNYVTGNETKYIDRVAITRKDSSSYDDQASFTTLSQIDLYNTPE